MAQKTDILLDNWSRLFESYRMARKQIEDLIKDVSPLALDEYDFLLILSREHQYQARLSHLADKTFYTRSGISRVSKRMLEKKYIKLEKCEEDKRGSFAVLTAEGIKAIKTTWSLYSEAILKTLENGLGEEENKNLGTLLEKIIIHLRKDELVQLNKSSSKT